MKRVYLSEVLKAFKKTSKTFLIGKYKNMSKQWGYCYMISNETGRQIGAWAFIIGIIVAAIISLIAAFGNIGDVGWVPPLMLILGLIVGLLNITSNETKMYLIAAIAFLISFGSLVSIAELFGPTAGAAFGTFAGLMVLFVAPGAAIVAVKTLFHLARRG